MAARSRGPWPGPGVASALGGLAAGRGPSGAASFTPSAAGCIFRRGQTVQAGGVLAEDLSLHGVGDVRALANDARGARPDTVPVRIVRGEQQPVGARPLDRLRQQRVLRIEAGVAVAAEARARLLMD